MNKIRLSLLSFFLFAIPSRKNNEDFCGIKNTSFQSGEVVTMTVFYNALGTYIGAGDATFTNTLERLNGKPVYHIVGTGSTYSFFDNFLFVVKESIIPL